jgi:hypothetical protein
MSMASIFINYRRGPHGATVEAIAERFRERFGRKSVFLDMQSIPFGRRYPDELRARLAQAKVMIAVIHRTWSQDRGDDATQPLISRDTDWVRQEIATALTSDILVVQVLLDGVEPLRPDELPADIRDLAHRQAALLRAGHFEDDLRHVMDVIANEIPELRRSPSWIRHRIGIGKAWWITGAALLVAAVAVATTLFTGSPTTAAGAAPPPAGRGSDAARTSSGGRPTASLAGVLGPSHHSVDIRSSDAEINGQPYPDSFIYTCDLCCESKQATIDFDPGRKFRRLSAIAGVLDRATDPTQTGYVQVTLDGVPQPAAPVRLGSPKTLDLDVTNVLRVRITLYREGTVTNCGIAGANFTSGTSNYLPELAVSDPTFSG